jgi:hypothetical protein
VHQFRKMNPTCSFGKAEERARSLARAPQAKVGLRSLLGKLTPALRLIVLGAKTFRPGRVATSVHFTGLPCPTRAALRWPARPPPHPARQFSSPTAYAQPIVQTSSNSAPQRFAQSFRQINKQRRVLQIYGSHILFIRYLALFDNDIFLFL